MRPGRRLRQAQRGLPLVIALAGCAHAPPPEPAKPGVTISAPARPRLAFVAWLDGKPITCPGTLDDEAKFTPKSPACMQGARDTSSPDAAGRCRFRREDAVLVPALKPARLFVGDKLLAEWTPDTDGDQFTLEPSLSPDGRQLAVLHVAIGLGEMTRTVETAKVTLLPAPDCK